MRCLTLLLVVVCYSATAQELPRLPAARLLPHVTKPVAPASPLYNRFVRRKDCLNAALASIQLSEYYLKQPHFAGALYYDSLAVGYARLTTDTLLLQKALASYVWTLSETFRLNDATLTIQTNNAVFSGCSTVESCNWQLVKATVLLKDMKFDAALAECQKGIGTAVFIQDSTALMQLKMLMAKMFVMKGFTDSVQKAYSAYDFFRKEQQLGKAAQAASVIALTFIRTANPDAALHYYRQAGILYRQDNDWNNVASAQMNIGDAWTAKNDYAAAKAAFADSRWFYQKSAQRSGLVAALIRLGGLYTTLHMYDSAAYCLLTAEATSKPLNSRTLNFIISGYKARLGLSTQDSNLINDAGKKAVDLLNERVDKQILKDLTDKLTQGDLLNWNEMRQGNRFLSRKTRNRPPGADILETQDPTAYTRMVQLSPFTGSDVSEESSITARTNRVAQGLEATHEAKEAKLELQAQKQAAKITQLEARQSKEKLQNEQRNKIGISISSAIIILIVATGLWVQYKNRRRAERDRAQIAELQKEIHHRVTNNLGVINAMVGMASKASASRLSMSALKTRIDSIALVHRLLYSGNAAIGKISLQPYFEELSTAIAAIFERDNKVKITIDAPVETDSGLAEKLGLIVNELITNSFKYAFTDKDCGTIHLYARQLKGELYLTVADNGIGLPPDVKKGQGSKLIKGLCHQLKGKYSYQNVNGAFLR